MRPTALALAGLLLAVPAAAQPLSGDDIELTLALWRHPADPPADLVEDGALLLDRTASEALRRDAFQQAIILREWRDDPHPHSPAQARVAAMGRRSAQ